MPKEFPNEFLDRLKNIVPEHYDRVAQSFDQSSPLIYRINELKVSVDKIFDFFESNHVLFERVEGMREAVCVDEAGTEFLKTSQLIEQGEVYKQGLSSMYVIDALAPEATEKVLDMCAAPGSKTSHIAARMHNTGEIVAVEAIRNRFYKLKSVLNLLGVENVTCLCMDGRRFSVREELFDRVLVDAPCSSEGRFKKREWKTYAYWSLRKIREMVKKQRGLLLNAARQLRSGGVLVYSTCTFAPEENEGVVDWFLRKTGGEFVLEPVLLKGVTRYSAITEWEKKLYQEQIKHCVRILPQDLAEGFFIARFRKM